MKHIDKQRYVFVDLGLPSGTLWCHRPLDFELSYCLIDYNEAKAFPHVATVEQAQELIDCSLSKYQKDKLFTYGANGRSIRFSLCNIEFEEKLSFKDNTVAPEENMAWLMGEPADSTHAKVLRASHDGFKGHLCIDSYFMAALHPVFLTVNKKEIEGYNEDRRVIGEVHLSEEYDLLTDRKRKVFEQITFEVESKAK